MEEVLRGLTFVNAGINDILIACWDIASHKQHLHEILQHLLQLSTERGQMRIRIFKHQLPREPQQLY